MLCLFSTPEQRAELDAGQPLGRVGVPEEVAKAVAFAISEDNLYMTGSTLTLDGGYMLAPGVF